MIINSIILAGGLGKRLEPISTAEKPKQFHDFFGKGSSLLQNTVTRSLDFSKTHKIYTVGNIHHFRILAKQLRKVDQRLTNKILFEPIPKNTAASVYLACKIVKKDIMVIMPSDHYIDGDFTGAIKNAAKIAEMGKIVTFGIKPSKPNDNYGYILDNKFFEKPDMHMAEQLISEGALWNSGIFVAQTKTLLSEFQKLAPQFFNSSFTNMPKLSFDKAIMENTNKLICLEAEFEWDDLGSWESLARYGCEYAYKYMA